MIRVWVGVLGGTGILQFEQSFAPAFWLGLSMHVVAGELWLWWHPEKGGLARHARAGAAGGT